jgi:glycerol-3-phosphate dehydrogenase (NAD(P)+)
MNKILILGFGVASTAYISLLDHNKKKVSVLGTPFDFKKIKNLNNLKIKKDRKFDLSFSKNINFYKSIEDVNKSKYSLIVVGVNSNGILWASKQLKQLKINCPILILTKGLFKSKKNIHKLSDFFKLKNNLKRIVYAAGPCLAGELIKKTHTRTVLASSSIRDSKYVKKILQNEYYHPEVSADIIGAEICAATKNIYATIIGSAAGQANDFLPASNKPKNYFNAASALFQQSIYEMNEIVKRFNGKTSTVLGPAGTGDLYVSALGGRNSKMGGFLGKGLLYKNIINSKMKGITIEGSELMLDVGLLLLKQVGKKKLPLACLLLESLSKNKKLKIDWKKFTN